MDDVFKYCRLCFQVTYERTELFTEENEYTTHLKLLEDVFNIQLTYVEGLPSTACPGCIRMIGESSAFVNIVLSSQNSFLRMLDQTEAEEPVASPPIIGADEVAANSETSKPTTIVAEDQTDIEDSEAEQRALEEKKEKKKLARKRKVPPCEKCGKKFCSMVSLRQHMLTHLPPEQRQALYVCEICGKGFDIKSQLTGHSYTHREKRSEKCKYCGKFYFGVYNHIRLVHMKQGEGKCHICGKEVKNLQTHMFCHKSERFPCQVCGKEFPRKSGLAKHEIIHKGVMFDCHFCEYSSNNVGNRAAHMKKKHPAEYEEYQRKQEAQWYEPRVKQGV